MIYVSDFGTQAMVPSFFSLSASPSFLHLPQSARMVPSLTPFFPPSGPATGPGNGVHPKSNFLAMTPHIGTPLRRVSATLRMGEAVLASSKNIS